DRIGPLLVVAVAVVEGDAGETTAEILLREPAVHLVERDQIDILAAQPTDDAREKLRRDLELPVRLETVAPRRTHVMQHQDRADAADERAHQPVRTAEIERLESEADDGVLGAHDAPGEETRYCRIPIGLGPALGNFGCAAW